MKKTIEEILGELPKKVEKNYYLELYFNGNNWLAGYRYYDSYLYPCEGETPIEVLENLREKVKDDPSFWVI